VFMVILILLSFFVPQSYHILPGPTLAWVMIGLLHSPKFSGNRLDKA